MLDNFLKFLGAEEPPPPEDQLRGPCCLNPDADHVFWGMQNVPVKAAVTHFFVVGAPSSGKTVSIELFLQSIAPRFMVPPHGQEPERLVIFDPKRDIISFLAALGLSGDIVSILNPFDDRSRPWAISEDITSPASAAHLASILIPEEKESKAPFFWQSARDLVRAVTLGLNAHRPKKWTFRDLLNALYTKERIQAAASKTEESKLIAQRYLADEMHFPTILSTIASKLGKFEVIAALWHHAADSPKFTIQNWIAGHGVLVLGNHPNFRESIAPINSLLLRVISDHLLSGPEVRAPRTWIILDEFRWMEQVDCVRELLNQGRSKGVSVLLGIQDIEGLKVVYGEHAANEILSQCANKTFLRLGSHPTAEWAEKHFAHKEEIEVEKSVSRGRDVTYTESYKVQTRPLFLQGEFLNLPLPEDSPNTTFEGIHDIPPCGGAIVTREDAPTVFAMVRRSCPQVQNEKKRPDEHQHFSVWTPKEEEDFLPPTATALKDISIEKPKPRPERSQFQRLMEMNDESLFNSH